MYMQKRTLWEPLNRFLVYSCTISYSSTIRCNTSSRASHSELCRGPDIENTFFHDFSPWPRLEQTCLYVEGPGTKNQDCPEKSLAILVPGPPQTKNKNTHTHIYIYIYIFLYTCIFIYLSIFYMCRYLFNLSSPWNQDWLQRRVRQILLLGSRPR